jgi:hypothetical protein
MAPLPSQPTTAYALAFPISVSVERFTIPAYATGEEASACAAGTVLVGLALDAPVVRQIDSAPGPIRKRRRFCAARIAKEEKGGDFKKANVYQQ